MGSYLSEPIKEKHTIKQKLQKIEYAVSSMQGWRISMEDAHITHPNFDKGIHLFAVFDGHGGQEIALYSEKNFGKLLKNNKYYQRGAYSDALKSTFLELDQEMRTPEGQKKLRELSGKDSNFGGCTANVMLIVNKRIYIANAGDSRSIVYNKKAIKLSFDHKPEDSEEYNRVIKAGGFVTGGRVCGNLNLSRALGDFDFKENSDLPAEEQMISALPDVVVREIEDGDDFVVMGCDGIWELMTDDEICQLIQSGLEMEVELGEIVEEILDRGCAKNTSSGFGCDNMSCIVVKLDKLC